MSASGWTGSGADSIPPASTRAGRLCIVVRESQTTILSWGERPGGRLPRGLCPHNARQVEAYNDRNFEPNIEPNVAANVFSNNVSNNFANNAWYNAACNCACSARRSSQRSCRRTCRRNGVRSWMHICRNPLMNNERYIARHKRAQRVGDRPALPEYVTMRLDVRR